MHLKKLLIIIEYKHHKSENDPLCPLPPIKKFYKKAQDLNLPVELEVIKGGGHGVSRAANAFKATILELAFLEKLLTR